MDPVTHGVLGGAIGGTLLGRRLGHKAVLLGALLAMSPDLDVVLDYGDAVANVTEHRGFSHSLFVLTGLGTLFALLARRFAPARDIPLGHWWVFFVLCLVTHPLLDALTTYGTQLWWPLDVRPSAYPIVFIIDPLYTLPLLVGVGVALVTGNGRRGPAWGLALSCAYLVFAFGAKQLVEQRLEPLLAEHGLQDAPRVVQPTPFNTLLWRATVMDGNLHHEALIGIFDGATPPRLETYTRGAALEPAALATEPGQRLVWFAGPFLRYEAVEIDGRETLTATDLRLGFPGFHPFVFTLATREAGEWQPLAVTEQLDSPYRADEERLTALPRLIQRIRSPEPMLCTSEFVDDRWVVEVPEPC
ncbi:metal-dependent hydrolase [Halomonas campisalis]|uniref:Metal-dependent hydrolase n=1 Tax=Billgrantia campisalis TaxID=74661 RepID=A0ABS9PAD7_9GAMM|nr:metal-dependent hydrolase [Halomonas campisalis]MCG6658616.1 metal-dependent hydrolase [Halomonas campisalis]MDR5863478.1 metal-dependent hydrolase [Halomonas campisalis]